MDEVRIIGKSVPAMPWQEKPEGHVGPLWRHTANPIIKRNPVKGVARVFNSAVAS
jgi:beta-1,4-mannooligosaccharide/beta-1,4-mannosyl-N-acetylglucosamine phosphorylase